MKYILRNMSFIPARWPRDVYLATGARAVSACGDFLAATALVLVLQQRGHGGLAVAAVLIAAAAPPVLLVRWTGRLVDRADSRLLLVATGLAQAGACVALAFAAGVAEIIALVSVLAAGLAVTGPSLSALLPALVTADDLPRATALGQTASAAGIMIAPALGGVLTGQFGLRVPLLADAASYLAIAAAGRLIRTRRGRGQEPALEQSQVQEQPHRRRKAQEQPYGPAREQPSDLAREQPYDSAREQPYDLAQEQPSEPAREQASDPARRRAGAALAAAWRLRDDALLRPALVLVGAVLAAVSLVNVAEVFFVRQDLHASATVYGLLSTAWIGTSVLGGQVLGRRRPSDVGLGVALLGALALACAAVAAMAAAPAAGWLVPLNIIGGLGNGGLNVATGVLIGRRVPAAVRGRAFAVLGAVINAASLTGFLLGGLLLAVISVRACIAAAGLFGLGMTAAFAAPLLRAAARDREQRGPAADGGPLSPASGSGRPAR
jgi:MFS family permease